MPILALNLKKPNIVTSSEVINGIQFDNRYSKRVVNDSKGNMLFKIENGRIYNAKGKEIDSSDFRDKMYKMLEKGKLGEYIQYP